MRIAFFTHHFLEPTHHAIAQIIGSLTEYNFSVFAKDFTDQEHFNLPNIIDRTKWTEGPIPNLTNQNFEIAHAIFDGKSALRAFMAAKLVNLPFILSFHGGFDTQSKIFDPRHQEWTKNAIQGANFVTVVCSSDEKRLKEIGVTRPIEIVKVPIDFSLMPKPKKRNPKQLLFVGRMIPKKGLDLALKAISILPKEYTLTIIGDGHFRNDFKELGNSLNINERLSWKGYLPLEKTLSIMQDSGLLLHPARVALDGNAEGNPQVILWAQAMKLPIISTPTGSIPDIISNGKSGLLVPPENPSSIAAAVLDLSENNLLREKIINEAEKQVRNQHSLTEISKKLQSIYLKASEGKSH